MAKIKISPSILKSHIMIVDDSAISRRKLNNDLRNKGFTNITEACSGAECIEKLSSTTPDLFLFDMLMPGMNGNELVGVVRNIDKHTETPIIIVTASEEETLIKDCFSLGANDFLRKPWDADELSTRVVSQIERLQNVNYLRKDQVRLSRALEVINDGIWECNIPNNELSFSPSCYRIFNISEDISLTIKDVLSLIHPEDLERITELFNKSLKANKNTMDFECRILLDNHIQRWIATRAKIAEYDSTGYPKFIVGVTRDITSQIIVQKHLQKFGKEMRELAEERSQVIIHSERLATLGTMAAGIAHEISNPLSYVRGNIQLLSKTVPNLIESAKTMELTEDNRQNLLHDLNSVVTVMESLDHGIHRICDLTNTIKNFSGKRADMSKISDIADAIDDALLLCSNSLKNGVKVEKNYNKDEFLLPFDLQQITQVLINLIMNAIHAMHNCGKITITTTQVENDMLLEIADTGTGIPETVRDKIFSAFYTTKKEGEGTGLGLYISKNIISEHNGRIIVENGEPAGTVFKIFLPLGNQKKEKTAKTRFEEAVSVDKLKVIIAEDDILVQEIIIQKLKVFSCNTIITTSIDDTVLAIGKEQPDAVLLSMSISAPGSIIEIIQQMYTEKLFPPIFIIEAEQYVKFPLAELKKKVNISEFESIDIIDSQDLSDLFG